MDKELITAFLFIVILLGGLTYGAIRVGDAREGYMDECIKDRKEYECYGIIYGRAVK